MQVGNDLQGGGMRRISGLIGLMALGVLSACGGGPGETDSFTPQNSESCMLCHNASFEDDYSGPGILNPHPFGSANNLLCSTCHGGNPDGDGQFDSHVPPPPEIGDRDFQEQNATAYFNRLTLTGIDKFPDYEVDGVTYTALDYLKFINPGDLRVTQNAQGCGQCHQPHSDVVSHSLLATSAGILSGASFSFGVENRVPESVDQFEDTAVDMGFREITDPTYSASVAQVGEVSRLVEYPVISQRFQEGPGLLQNNPDYNALLLSNDLLPDGRVQTDSNLADLLHEQMAFTCGDCHLGSAGANNRTGDYRSSGCTSCHMPYSLGGRYGGLDPNVNRLEPLDPDDIDDPERPHVRSHQIVSIAQTLPDGTHLGGIDDLACAGCHQGSNRTVMQYWGIRLDQNQDVRRGVQYPANPVSYRNTSGDTRLFDPELGNNEFNGRNRNQYLLEEDYDGDGRDDTPPDVHYEAGMGCIDCHGSFDLHGGDVTAPDGHLASRMEQAVAIRCEDCHGTAEARATTVAGSRYDGTPAQVGADSFGNAMRHVVQEGDDLFLYSRLTGAKHYIPQTLDTIVDSGVVNPLNDEPVYSTKASFAMGRVDGDAATGIGPTQAGGVSANFSHTDRMDCATCHSAWTNTCMGCHLEGEYNGGNNFSNITGERIVFRERFADFVYQSPLFMQLGVNSHDEIANLSANTKTFFRYEDQEDRRSDAMSFADRRGAGNKPGSGCGALSHNAMMAHSVRGKVDDNNEGPRYCVTCHITDDGMANYGTEYNTFRTAIANRDYASLDYDLLKVHLGQNTSNHLDSPLFVHMTAGLGTGLFTFDALGRPINNLDTNENRRGTDLVEPQDFQAPVDYYDPALITLDLDRIVEADGTSNSSNNHVQLDGPSSLRSGLADQEMAGPLPGSIITLLTDPVIGLVLDTWLDSNGDWQGAGITNPDLGGE